MLAVSFKELGKEQGWVNTNPSPLKERQRINIFIFPVEISLGGYSSQMTENW